MHKAATMLGMAGLAALAAHSGEQRSLALASLAMLALLATLEAKYPKDRRGRKTVHFLGGIAAALLIILAGARTASISLAAGLIALVAISKMLKKGVYVPVFSEGIKSFEREGVAPLYGSITFLFGAALSAALFPAYAAAGMLATGVGDAFSTVVGMHFGKVRIGKKSIEGALAFFATSFFVCAQILPFEKALVAAVAGAAIELLPIGVDDNVTIPVGVAGILSLLG